ncbi:MAG: DUF5663 domain-containing protein [Candidatus Altiarchaeota archaeon]
MEPSDDKWLDANIFELIHFKGTEEEKMEILGDLTEDLQMCIGIRIMDKLTPKEQDEFIRLSEEMDPEKISSFINAKLPDMEKVFKEEIVKFKKDFVKEVWNVKAENAAMKGGAR